MLYRAETRDPSIADIIEAMQAGKKAGALAGTGVVMPRLRQPRLCISQDSASRAKKQAKASMLEASPVPELFSQISCVFSGFKMKKEGFLSLAG
jgi:hypothetical protein